MKVLIAVLALVAVVAADEWAPKKVDEIKAIRAQCLADNPIPAEHLEKIKAFEYPDVEPVRKYILCNLQKLDLFCEHEGFHADRVAKQFKLDLDLAEAVAIAEKCADKNEEKSSSDVWAFRGHQCLLHSKIGDGIKDFIKKLVAKA